MKLPLFVITWFSLLIILTISVVIAELLDSGNLYQPVPIIPEIKPPFAFIADADMTSVALSWANQPGSSVKIAGYFIYYWQQLQGFEKVELVSDRIIQDQKITIQNLYPETKYCFAVRAATSDYVDNAERIGDYFLSRFSEINIVETESNTKIELLSATLTTAIFRVSKFDVIANDWRSADFFCELNNNIGGIKTMDRREVDFRTDFVLTAIKAIQKPSKELENLTFADISDPKIKIEIPFPAKKTENKIIYRATVLNSKNKRLLNFDSPN